MLCIQKNVFLHSTKEYNKKLQIHEPSAYRLQTCMHNSDVWNCNYKTLRCLSHDLESDYWVHTKEDEFLLESQGFFFLMPSLTSSELYIYEYIQISVKLLCEMFTVESATYNILEQFYGLSSEAWKASIQHQGHQWHHSIHIWPLISQKDRQRERWKHKYESFDFSRLTKIRLNSNPVSWPYTLSLIIKYLWGTCLTLQQDIHAHTSPWTT